MFISGVHTMFKIKVHLKVFKLLWVQMFISGVHTTFKIKVYVKVLKLL